MAKSLIWMAAAMSWGCSSPETPFLEMADSAVDWGAMDADAMAQDAAGTAPDARLSDAADPPDLAAAVDATPDMSAAPDATPDMAEMPDAMPLVEPARITCERVDAEGRRTNLWVLDAQQRPIAHDDHGPFLTFQGERVPPSEEPTRSEAWTYDADGNLVGERVQRDQPGRDIEVTQTWDDGLLTRRNETRHWDGTVTNLVTVYTYEARRLTRATTADAQGRVRDDQITTYDMQGRRVRLTYDWSRGSGADLVAADGVPDTVGEWTYPEPGLETYERRDGVDGPVNLRSQLRRDAQDRVTETLIDTDADGVIDQVIRRAYDGDRLIRSEFGLGDPEAAGYVAQIATFTYTPTRQTMWRGDAIYAQTDCSAPVEFHRLTEP